MVYYICQFLHEMSIPNSCLTQIEIGIQIIGRLLIDHAPGKSHTGADVVRQRGTGLQAGILVQRRQYLIEDRPFDLAQRKAVHSLVQMMPHRAIEGEARLVAAVQGAVESATHLQHFAFPHAVAQAKRKLKATRRRDEILNMPIIISGPITTAHGTAARTGGLTRTETS